MTYAEKLKDPRWQKRRLEILQRDDWTCIWCGCKEKTLHVHHFCYTKGKEPWEAQEDELGTVCEDCHMLIHVKLPVPIQEIFDVITTMPGFIPPSAAQAIIEIIKKYILK